MEQYVNDGFALVIFSGRSAQPECGIDPGRSTARALIAQRTGAFILPVGITGTENLKGWYWIF